MELSLVRHVEGGAAPLEAHIDRIRGRETWHADIPGSVFRQTSGAADKGILVYFTY